MDAIKGTDMSRHWFIGVWSLCCLGWTPGARSAELPPVTDGVPMAGARVRVTAPEYEGTDVHHTLYLPTDWQPGGRYGVIVEFAPNQYSQGGESFSGSVDDTQLGFYQTGGVGFVWVSMPFINGTAPKSREATTWWGNGNVRDPDGEARTAEYTATNLRRILEDYGGDPASVFVTGFSRGAIAAGYIALRDEAMADMWLGFLPHSHHDGGSFTPDPDRVRLSRIAGRASFITYGQRGLDGGAENSRTGAQILQQLAFPFEQHELLGVGHTDAWIADSASDGSLLVRDALRNWLSETMSQKPGTHTIHGTVIDADGRPVRDVLIETGATHFTRTDEEGQFALAGLIAGPRTLSAKLAETEFLDNHRLVTLVDDDLHGLTFVALRPVPEPDGYGSLALLSWLLTSSRCRPRSISIQTYP